MPAVLVPLDSGKPIVLDKPIVLVGRHPDCDAVILNSRKISRKHCAIALVNNCFIVRDLGSMNGIWINGERVEVQSPLRFGDELMVGDVRYCLQADASPKSKPKPNDNSPVATAPAEKPAAAEPQARKKPLITPPNAELSLEFPVPIDEDDGSAVPAPAKTPTDSGDDEFIPLKSE
jgi:predicted component of type VI protein secretion system